MLSALVVCVLVVGAMAAKPGKPFDALMGVRKVSQEPHEPCCAPRYFTFEQANTLISESQGSLLVEEVKVAGAYDSISERVSLFVHENFFNTTEYSFRVISDYKEEVEYFIFRDGDELICFESGTQGRFPEECVPDDAQFVGEATIGDYDLLVDNWYYASAGGTEHTVKTVQHGGCVPVSLFTRTFDPETGEELEVSFASAYDFNLGICDPDKFFKIPEECKSGVAQAVPTSKMLKMRRLTRLFH